LRKVGGVLLCGLIVLAWIEQDDARHNFRHIGGMFYLISYNCDGFIGLHLVSMGSV